MGRGWPIDFHARAIRVALRQLKARGHASAALNAWLALHEHAEEDETDDDTQALGH